MTWSYRTVLGLGVGIVAVGLTLWAASQNQLLQQLSTQALPGGAGACYWGRSPDGLSNCQDKTTFALCNQKKISDPFLPGLKVQDSMWVAGGMCDTQSVRYVSAEGMSYVTADNLDATQETANETCKKNLTGRATFFECPYGMEKYLHEPTVTAYDGYTAGEAFTLFGLQLPDPSIRLGRVSDAMFRSKCGAMIQCKRYPFSPGQPSLGISLVVPEPSIAPAPPITPSPTPIVKAPQSIWCLEEATSSPEHLWGAYCCRERSPNLIGPRTCKIGYSANPTKAVCESTLPNQGLSQKLTTFGWSTWTCSRAKDDAIARAQGTIDVIKAKCPSGKTTVECELVDSKRNITLACHATVECTVTCDFTPRCN